MVQHRVRTLNHKQSFVRVVQDATSVNAATGDEGHDHFGSADQEAGNDASHAHGVDRRREGA
jgi:hypothetical protein